MSIEYAQTLIHRLFGLGMHLQAVSSLIDDQSEQARLDEVIAELDDVIRDLRERAIGTVAAGHANPRS